MKSFLVAAALVLMPVEAFAASTATKVEGVGQPGTPNGGVLSIQGAGGGTGIPLAQTTVTTTDHGGTITGGGTAQTAISSNTSRKGWCISNDPAATETLYVRVNGTASATTGTPLSPGQQTCNQTGLIDTSAVSVFASTTSHRYFGFEAQ